MSRKRHHGRTKMAILHFFCWWFVFMKIGHAVRSITMDQWPSQVISGDNITLGCSFVPEDENALASIEVAWHVRSNSHWTVAYHYVNGTEHLVDQDKRFPGRAWILAKELNEYKASLRIRSVRLTDRGEYRCIVIDNDGAAFDSAYLTVLAPYSSPRLTAIYGNGTVILHCLSEGGYPQGEVIWHNGKEEQLNQLWSTEWLANSAGGFHINSTVSVPLQELKMVCCSVIHTVLHQNVTACKEIKAEHMDSRNSRNRPLSIVAIFLVLFLCGIGITSLKASKCERCKRKHFSRRNTRRNIEMSQMGSSSSTDS